MIKTTYSSFIEKDTLIDDLMRLTNQIWKLIPMRENNELWVEHLNTVIAEISGLYKVLDLDSLILLSKLEGLKYNNIDFMTYRSSVFKCINILNKVLMKK